MPTNFLLLRWSEGWAELGDGPSVAAYGRKEGFLSLGAQQSIQEVYRQAERELAVSALIREQAAVVHYPQDLTETPWVAYLPGDQLTVDDFYGTATTPRVTSCALTEDEDGNLTFVPTLGDELIGLEEAGQEQRLEQAARKMINGTLGGVGRMGTPPAV